MNKTLFLIIFGAAVIFMACGMSGGKTKGTYETAPQSSR